MNKSILDVSSAMRQTHVSGSYYRVKIRAWGSAGSGKVGSGRVGSDRIVSYRIGSDRIGSFIMRNHRVLIRRLATRKQNSSSVLYT